MKKTSFIKVIAVILILVVLSSCGNSLPPLIPSNETSRDAHLSMKYSIPAMDFGLSLFRQINLTATGDRNILISPVAASLALVSLLYGADENTFYQIEKTLKIDGLDITTQNAFIGSLTYNFAYPDKENSLFMVNSLISPPDVPLKDSYLKRIQELFSTKHLYCENEDSASIQMNEWLLDGTKGFIQDFSKKISDKDGISLLNVVNFRCPWEKPLSAHTQDGYIDDNTLLSDNVLYSNSDKYDMVALPFLDMPYTFLAILPRDGNEQ